MTKTLETKKKILRMLKKKEMTISELSRNLNLSSATVSQHIDELQRSGAVERVNNEFFKKLKYYRVAETASPITARYVKYVIGVVAIIAIISLIYLSRMGGTNPGTSKLTIVPTNVTAVVSPVGSFGCPNLQYEINGTIENYSGFSLYYLNSSYGTIADYVISRSTNGVLSVREYVISTLSNNSISRQHYAILTQENSSNTTASGISLAINPENYTITRNAAWDFNITMDVNQTAQNKTYWLRIDGPCGGGVPPFLVTIGNEPYKGNVTFPTSIYA